MRLVSKIIIGFVFGLLILIPLVPGMAAFSTEGGSAAIWIVLAVAIVLIAWAPTIRRAFGRGFLLLGAAVFVLPISTMLLSGRIAHDVVTTAPNGGEVGAAVGTGLAGIALTGVSVIVGLFLGAVFLIIGLVLALGGRRQVEVIYVERGGDPRL